MPPTRRLSAAQSDRGMFTLPNPDYEGVPEFQHHLGQVDDALRAEALAKFLPHFEGCYHRHLTSPELNYDDRIDKGDALLRRLQETGCGLARVSPERLEPLKTKVVPVAEWLHRRLTRRGDLKFRDTQRKYDRENDPDVFEMVERLFEEEHVYAAASTYASRPLVLKEVTVQVNTDFMTRRDYGELDAQGLPSPRTRYMHIDSALWPPVKVLIYLSEVTPDRGPFRYVEGSHRMATDFELMVRKTNDRLNMHGSLFMALPPPFRMYTLFGDNIDPDSEEARRLLEREHAYTSADGDLMLFDFNGVHRGGFVREGHRYMLQCHFERRAKVERRAKSGRGEAD